MSHTCVSCALEFPDAPAQRAHMKLDWHRYNLKRRVAQLPAISEAVFVDKIAQMAADDELSEDVRAAKAARKQVTKKDVRRQQKEALQAQRRELLAARERLQDQFGLLRVAASASLSEGPNDLSKEDSDLPKETSDLSKEPKDLSKEPKDLSKEPKDLSKEPSDLSKEPKDLSKEPSDLSKEPSDLSKQHKDLSHEPPASSEEPNPSPAPPASPEEQLVVQKLANRVHIPVTTCLFCPASKHLHFASLDDNLAHMFKAHGLYVPEKSYLVDPEGLVAYLGEKIGLGNVCLVCSYQGKNIDAVRLHMLSKRHMQIPYEDEQHKLEISDFYDFTASYGPADADAWEDVSDDAGSDVDGSDADGSDDDDSDIPDDPLIDMGTELILPSGAVVGHRSMARYYRQNLAPEKILSEGQGTVIAAETRHFAAPAQRHQLAMAKRAWGHQKKREDTNDRRAQKFINNQPHFRDPLLQ